MARTALAASQIHEVSSTQHVTIVAGAQEMGFAASDTANGNEFTASGKDILFAYNVNGAAQTVTVTLKADEYGRAGSVTAYSLAVQFDIAYIGILDGAYNTSDLVLVDTSSDDIHLAVLRL